MKNNKKDIKKVEKIAEKTWVTPKQIETLYFGLDSKMFLSMVKQSPIRKKETHINTETGVITFRWNLSDSIRLLGGKYKMKYQSYFWSARVKYTIRRHKHSSKEHQKQVLFGVLNEAPLHTRKFIIKHFNIPTEHYG